PTTFSYILSLHDALPIYRTFHLLQKPDIFICYRHRYLLRYLLSCFGGTHACDRLRLNRASDHVVRDSSDLVGPLLADGCKQSEGDRKSTRLNSSHVSISY